MATELGRSPLVRLPAGATPSSRRRFPPRTTSSRRRRGWRGWV